MSEKLPSVRTSFTGQDHHGVEKQPLRQAIAEFFFMASMTGRYTSSPETKFDFDLAQLRGLPDGALYLRRLREICATTLTNDYWEITLPIDLATSAARSPSRFAYQASLIRLGAQALYLSLCGKDTKDTAATKIPVEQIIASGESDEVEFKSTLRTNLHTGQVDEKMHLAALKTIAGFLNARGGTLIVGVSDDGKLIGIGADNFQNEDKMALHLVNLIRDRIGDLFLPYVHPHFDEQDGDRVMVIRCEKGPRPAFVKDGVAHRFFVRSANATTELAGGAVTDYVKARFA